MARKGRGILCICDVMAENHVCKSKYSVAKRQHRKIYTRNAVDIYMCATIFPRWNLVK